MLRSGRNADALSALPVPLGCRSRSATSAISADCWLAG